MIIAPPLTKYTHRLVDVYLPLRYHLLPFEKISNKETCYGNPARCCLFSGHVLGLHQSRCVPWSPYYWVKTLGCSTITQSDNTPLHHHVTSVTNSTIFDLNLFFDPKIFKPKFFSYPKFF